MEKLRITVEGKVYDVVVEKIEGDEPPAAVPQAVAAAPRAVPVATHAPAAPVAPPRAGEVISPLAGTVHSIELEVGAVVSEGDLVMTLDAMKMSTSVNAPAAGTITAIQVSVGDGVAEGQALYTIG